MNIKDSIYIKYIYVILINSVIVLTVFFIIKLIKVLKKGNTFLKEPLDRLNAGLEKTTRKTEIISKTSDSWSAFLSAYVIISIIKETMRSKKEGKSAPKALVRSAITHSSALSKIRI